MSYGLDGNGFTVKPLNVIISELEAQYRAAYGAGLPLGPDTEMGKEIAILADRESPQWELQQAVYNAFYPNSASDISLARI